MFKLLVVVACFAAAGLAQAEVNPFTQEHSDPMYRTEFEIFFQHKEIEPEVLLAKVDQLLEFYRRRVGDVKFERDDIGREVVRDVGKLNFIGHVSADNCDDLAAYNKMVDDWYNSRTLLSAQKFFQHYRAEQNKLCA